MVLTWITMAGISIGRHHPASMYVWIAALWTVMSTSQITTSFPVAWSFESDGLAVKKLRSSQHISYADIIAVRRKTDPGMPFSKLIEIEHGRLGSTLNPRCTILANPKERAAFIERLRASTPQAAFEL